MGHQKTFFKQLFADSLDLPSLLECLRAVNLLSDRREPGSSVWIEPNRAPAHASVARNRSKSRTKALERAAPSPPASTFIRRFNSICRPCAPSTAGDGFGLLGEGWGLARFFKLRRNVLYQELVALNAFAAVSNLILRVLRL